MVRMLIIEAAGLCVSGSLERFREDVIFQEVSIRGCWVAECEPHPIAGCALKMTPVSTAQVCVLIHKRRHNLKRGRHLERAWPGQE